MPDPEILVFSTLGLVAVLAVLILSLKPRRRRAVARNSEEGLIRLDARVADAPVDGEIDEDDSEIEPAYESDFALTSIESLELVDENREPEPAPLAPVSEEIEEEEIDADLEDEFLAEIEAPEIFEAKGESVEIDEPTTIEAEDTEEEEPMAELEAAPVSEVLLEEAESVEETIEEVFTEEEVVASTEATEAEHASEMTLVEASADSSDETVSAVGEPEEIEAPVSNEEDEEMRRATLRRAPRRHRRPRTVDENLDSQISDLDDRLDALEALVASIEQGLAEFEPLLEEVDAEAEMAVTGDEVEGGDDHAQAA